MILIFDLDDTLYPERTYVESGFRAVAQWLSGQFGWPEGELRELMLNLLETEGRGHIFERVLERNGVLLRGVAEKCLGVYRGHRPDIFLDEAASLFLRTYNGPLYVVTDGNKMVQQKKVDALGLSKWFKKVLITHRYGVSHAKPSTYCFEKIKEMEKCSWADLVYIGDNPAKDFVNLNPLGVLTIRVLTGEHRHVQAKAGFDASVTVSNFDDLDQIILTL